MVVVVCRTFSPRSCNYDKFCAARAVLGQLDQMGSPKRLACCDVPYMSRTFTVLGQNKCCSGDDQFDNFSSLRRIWMWSLAISRVWGNNSPTRSVLEPFKKTNIYSFWKFRMDLKYCLQTHASFAAVTVMSAALGIEGGGVVGQQSAHQNLWQWRYKWHVSSSLVLEGNWGWGGQTQECICKVGQVLCQKQIFFILFCACQISDQNPDSFRVKQLQYNVSDINTCIDPIHIWTKYPVTCQSEIHHDLKPTATLHLQHLHVVSLHGRLP